MCTGGRREDVEGCCSKQIPCKEGEGHCNDDVQCEGSLRCGQQNCGPKFIWDQSNCCAGKNNLKHFPPPKYFSVYIIFLLSLL